MKTPYVALVFERQESRLGGFIKRTVKDVVSITPGTQVAFWEKMDDTGTHHHVIGTGPGSFIERIYYDNEGNVRIDVKGYWNHSPSDPYITTVKLENVVEARVIHHRPDSMRGR